MYTDDPAFKEYLDKMNKTVEALESQFATVRAGRANAAVLNHLRVDYYGVPTPINQVGTISSPDPRTLVIQPSRRPSWPPTWASTPRMTAPLSVLPSPN